MRSNTVWLVLHFYDRTVWSVWSSEQKAVLAGKRYRESARGTTLFEIVPIEIDRDSFVRPPGERGVDDLD
jgi:hypothetical protein